MGHDAAEAEGVAMKRVKRRRRNIALISIFWICVENTNIVDWFFLIAFEAYNRHIFERRVCFTSQPRHTMVKRHVL